MKTTEQIIQNQNRRTASGRSGSTLSISNRLTWAFALAAAAGLLMAPGALADHKGKPHGKPGGDGGDDGGGSTSQPCVVFDDFEGDSLQSDTGAPYCHDQKQKVTVSFTQDGHLALDTNSSNKKGVGRSLYIDFGAPIEIVDLNGVLWEFQTTADLDEAGIIHDVNLVVGPFQDDFNMLTMELNEVRTDVNLWFTLYLHFVGQRQEVPIFVKMAPNILDNNRQCEISDPVLVACIGVDSAGNANAWRVETQEPFNGACVSQDPFGHDLGDLTVGIRHFSFGFTVTR